MDEKKYEEVGHAYRYFLGWRHAAFAGYILVLYGVVSLLISATKDAPSLTWVIPIAASPIGFFLWWIDRRTRDLYHAAQRAGTDLEGEGGGFFTRLNETSLPPGASVFSRTTQSGALNTFFLGFSLLLLVAGVVLALRTLCASDDAVDGVNGWEDWACYRAAMELLGMEETDPSSAIVQSWMLLDQQIEDLAGDRSQSAPQVQDVEG